MAGRPAAITEANVRIVNELGEQGCTLSEIAEAIGVSERTVSRYKRRGGVLLIQKYTKTTPEWHEKVQGLLAEGYSHRAIGEMTNVSPCTVSRHYPGTCWTPEQVSEFGHATQMLQRLPNQLKGVAA